MAHDRYVVLERHPLAGFGFSIIGGVDTHLPPMVCALVHNGSAILSGKVSLTRPVEKKKNTVHSAASCREQISFFYQKARLVIQSFSTKEDGFMFTTRLVR